MWQSFLKIICVTTGQTGGLNRAVVGRPVSASFPVPGSTNLYEPSRAQHCSWLVISMRTSSSNSFCLSFLIIADLVLQDKEPVCEFY